MKVIVIGEAGVGKSSLIRRIATNKFEQSYLLTVGMDPTSVSIPLNGEGHRDFILNVWDIAGQKKFQIFKQAFYRGAEAAVAVFDLTRPASLEKLDEWITDFRARCGDKPVMLVGNKKDLQDLISVTADEITEFSQRHQTFTEVETSALTGEGVLDAFRSLVYERIGKPLNTHPSQKIV